MPTPVVPAELVPDVEGLKKEYNYLLRQWYFVTPDSNSVIARWDTSGPSGRIRIIAEKLLSQWKGLYYRAEINELSALSERQIQESDRVFLLPVDPTVPGTAITFRSWGTGKKKGWGILIETPNTLLVRAPVAGKAYPMEYGADPSNPEGQEATIEYREGIWLMLSSENYAFFGDGYEFLPARHSNIEAGAPWVTVPVGETGVASVRIGSAYSMSKYNTKNYGRFELSGLLSEIWEFLNPENLLQTEDGRIVYVAQE